MGKVFLSENAWPELVSALAEDGQEIYRVGPTDLVDSRIAAHADIYMCRVGDTLLIDDGAVLTPSLKDQYEEEGRVKDGGRFVFSTGSIGSEYPFDVPYNAVSTGSYFIHNTEYTSPELIDRARYTGLQIINVNQGYTRCSCLPVGNTGLITSDEGIARTIRAYNEIIEEEYNEYNTEAAETGRPAPADAGLRETDRGAGPGTIDVLLIRKGNIGLKGFEYGFIGGTGGAVGSRIYFNGDLSGHPDFDEIHRFITEHGFEPVWFEGRPLTDIGSVIWMP